MEIKFIEHLSRLVEHSNIVELEFKKSDCRVRLSKVGLTSNPLVNCSTPISAPLPLSPTSTSLHSDYAPPADLAVHSVSSSLVGLFYSSPAPDKPPFVRVGDLVVEGQTLAIIEAMKMLNPIEADRNGRVTVIHKKDGDMIEAGSPLFTIAVAE